MTKKAELRILIIGESFNQVDGGGITLTNLFFDFPPRSLACIIDANRVSVLSIDGPTRRIYALGFLEKIVRFPFGLFKNKYPSGPVDLGSLGKVVSSPTSQANTIRTQLIAHLTPLYNFLGLQYWIFRFRMSSNLHNWIKEFEPTHIYAQFNTLEMMLLLGEIHRSFPVRLFIHFMDDWPSVVVKEGVFERYWKKRFDTEIRQLLSRSDRLLSISDGMSEAFKERYEKHFESYHNPIDIKLWRKHHKVSYSPGQSVTLLYAGRIGLGSIETLIQVAKAITIINSGSYSIKLQIQAPWKTVSSDVKERLLEYDSVTILEPVPYELLPERFGAADLLLLPYDFNLEGSTFIRYSMPTKATEYMISGTPVVLVAPKETYIAQNAAQYHWADWIDSDDANYIASRLTNLLNDPCKMERIAMTAVQHARNNYSTDIIRQRFLNLFTNESRED